MSTESARIESAPELPYDLLATHYDRFTAHHDYEAWMESLLVPLARHGLMGSRMLDVGSGTGKSLQPMLRRGWRITACDRSTRMLDQLRAKFSGVETSVVDARNLPALGAFDLVLSLGDILNYVAAESSIETCLRGFRRNLAEGGLALFDMNTLATYRGVYTQRYLTHSGDRVLEWIGGENEAYESGQIATATISIRPRDRDSGASVDSVHRQRHVPESAVREAIDSAGLECLEVFGHGYDGVLQQPLDEEHHTKAIYITRDRNTEEKRR